MRRQGRTLVIDRSRWLRGEGNEESCLLRERDGKMCCLGFDARAMGLPDAAIRNIESPNGIKGEFLQAAHDYPHGVFRGFPKWGADLTGTVYDLMRDNDSQSLLDDQREARIRYLLKIVGWDDVVFVDHVNDEGRT